MDVNESTLDPEAEEFLPGFKNVGDYVQSGFGLLMTATRWSNALPPAHTLFGYDNPTSGYRKACAALRHNASEVFKTVLSRDKLDSNKIGKDFENLPDINDGLVDSINADLALLEGRPKALESAVNITKPARYVNNQPSWNSSPVVCSLQMGKTKMLAAKNIERPQLSFKDKVDNSTKTLWTPRLTEKPNNLKPLAIMPLYNDNGDIFSYAHPYEVELEAFSPPVTWLTEGLGRLELKEIDKTPLTMVDSVEQLTKLVQHLRTVKEIAVDMEHHSFRTYQGITCLLQISTEEGGDFLVDTLVLREHLHQLNESFTNPKILKVFHGADSDIIWLQRDLGVYVVGLFDTHQAAIMLEQKTLSLQALINRYCGVFMDKKHQLADWRIRPLPQELCDYARNDTHSLLFIWRIMREELLKAAGGRSNLLEAVFTKSKLICLKTYVKPVTHEDSYMDLYLRSKKHFNVKQLAAFKSLYQWRDGVARLEDESTGYVLPNHMLLQISESLPREMQGLLACCNPIPPLLKRHLLTVHQMVLCARVTIAQTEEIKETPLAMPPPTPSILKFVHDNLEDFREGLPVYLDGGGVIKRQRKKHNRKPWSLETPPVIAKDADLSSVKIRFVPPYQRCLMVKDYQESR